MTAARTGRLAAVQALLARGARVDDKLPTGGQTALMWAAHEGHADVVAALITAHADFRKPVDTGFTPLLFAARRGHAAVIRSLLTAGVDLNEPTAPAKKVTNKQPRPGTTALIIVIAITSIVVTTGVSTSSSYPHRGRTVATCSKPMEDHGTPTAIYRYT